MVALVYIAIWSKIKLAQPLLIFVFLIFKISMYFLHLRIQLTLSTILQTSNNMVFKMVFEMVFVSNVGTIKLSGRNSVK